MKKLLIGLTLVAVSAAQAQTSSSSSSTTDAGTSTSSTSAKAAATTPATAGAPSPSQTLTTTMDEAGGLRKKVSATLYLGLATDAAPANNAETRKTAEISSENYLNLGYKLSETEKISLRHNFGWTMSGEKNGTYTLIDPSVIYSRKGPKLGGFEPLSSGITYYVPVSEKSREKKSAGTLRADVSADYNVTPKVALGLFASPRLTLNTTSNTANADGSDSTLRMVAGGAATYNFNDRYNTYYSPFVDFKTTNHNRGKVDANVASPLSGMSGQGYNIFVHEIGLNMQVMKELSLTPAVINYVSLNTGEGFGREEMLEYDLYVTANF